MATPQQAASHQSRAFTLTFKGPLHVGEAGVGIEESLAYLPSDTIFSALVVTWLTMGRADLVDQLASRYPQAPPLLLSSAMPFAGGLRFFPKPLLVTQMDDGQQGQGKKCPAEDSTKGSDASGDEPRSGKSFRRVKWVSESNLARLVNGISPQDLYTLWQEGQTIQGGAIWLSQADYLAVRETLHCPTRLPHDAVLLWQSGQNPKVAIDRMDSSSALYSVGSTRFADRCGLWLLAQGEAPWLEAMEEALTLLQDSGLGGRRSRGNGAFDLTRVEPWATLPQQPGGHQMMLSRLAPTQTDMPLLLDDQSNYQLIKVGGWNGTPGHRPFLRKSVRLLVEGSVIQQASGGIPGQLVDVNVDTPAIQINHPIYRYGMGLGIGVKIHA